MVLSHGAKIKLPPAEFHSIVSLFGVSKVDLEPAFFLFHFASILNLIPNLTRLLILILFIVSFVLRPRIQGPIMTLWRRIIESDKPIFTLVLGGLAALVKAIQQIVS